MNIVSRYYYTYSAECSVVDLTTNEIKRLTIPISRRVSNQQAALRAVEKTKPPNVKVITVDRIRINRLRYTQPDIIFKAHGAITANEENWRTVVLERE